MVMAAAISFMVLLASTATLASHSHAQQQQHVVGEGAGWRLNVNYDAWSDGKKFTVGDTLVFNYNSDHGVIQVSEDDYNACATDSPMATFTGGQNAIPLFQPGAMFFICPTPNHCMGGMKLAINVVQAEGTTTPTIPGGSIPTPTIPGGTITETPCSLMRNSGGAAVFLFHKLNYLIIGFSVVKMAMVLA